MVKFNDFLDRKIQKMFQKTFQNPNNNQLGIIITPTRLQKRILTTIIIVAKIKINLKIIEMIIKNLIILMMTQKKNLLSIMAPDTKINIKWRARIGISLRNRRE